MSENIQKNEKLKKYIDSELNETQIDSVSGGVGLFGATGVEMDFGDLEGNELKVFSVDKAQMTVTQKTGGKNNQVMNSGGFNYKQS